MPEFVIPDFDKAQLRPPLLVAGTYTLNVREEPVFDASKPESPYVDAKFVIVDGPPQEDGSSPVDRETRDRFYISGKAGWRVKAYMVAAGRMSRDDNSSPIGKGKLNTGLWLGTTVKAKISHRLDSKTGNTYLNFEYVA